MRFSVYSAFIGPCLLDCPSGQGFHVGPPYLHWVDQVFGKSLSMTECVTLVSARSYQGADGLAGISCHHGSFVQAGNVDCGGQVEEVLDHALYPARSDHFLDACGCQLLIVV